MNFCTEKELMDSLQLVLNAVVTAKGKSTNLSLLAKNFLKVVNFNKMLHAIREDLSDARTGCIKLIQLLGALPEEGYYTEKNFESVTISSLIF